MLGPSCLEAFFPLAMSLGGPFGTGKIGLSGEGEFRGGEVLEAKFGQEFFCMEEFFV